MDPIVTTARMGVTSQCEGLVHGNFTANPVPDQFNGKLSDFVVPGAQAYLTVFGMKADELGVMHGKGYFAIVDGQGHLVFEDKDCAFDIVPGAPSGDFPTAAKITATGVENRTGYAYALRTEGVDPKSPQGDLIVALGRADVAGSMATFSVLNWALHSV